MIQELIPTKDLDFLEAIALSIGSKVDGNTVELPQHIGNGFIKGFKINPHLYMIIRQYELKNEWVLKKIVGEEDKEVVMIAFHNIFRTRNERFDRKSLPSVQVTTAGLDYQLFLPAGVKMNSIVIAVHIEYLKELLNPQKENAFFKTLLSGFQPILFEEIISARIQNVATEIIEEQAPKELQLLYVKAKAEELIYLLFVELLKRQSTSVRSMSVAELKIIYQVRDKILSFLHIPPRLNELAKFSGMSESKLKRSFKQVFGTSIYSYYQNVRIQEAAYLLKEHKLTVSEVGHQLGFSNLSHFTRLFKEHLGVKPKKYSQESA
ncbi:AraC family transcriptional regulator [Cytophagaceae bacterium YF14B1]|uniref:AraC family transcriptional regulator n=1 Tax=Xanthocytophaga flava TaxID=3048013 RepID=A0AAE3U6T3_9BACT|nr:AraC family transcriptional regulator [Xanthocytophaga flavus]MDJ1480902.1 AraC family transcriptional regulator [Xanthocytophaga flavus]